jgi:hypothetical protein
MLGLGNSLSNIIVPAAGGSYTNDWSISFDGTNDFFASPANFHATFRDSFAISMWFKTPSAGAGITFLMGLDQDTDSDNTYFFISYDEANNRIHTRFQSAGYAVQNYTATDGIGDDAWVHLVYTVNKTGTEENAVFDLYINGTADTTTEAGTMRGDRQSSFIDTDTVLNLALYGSSYGDVDIHDFAIFSSYLDANNAAAIYNSGTSIDLSEETGDYDNSSNLVVYYKMDEGTGTSAADSAGSNNGSLRNGAAWAETKPS